MSSRASRVQRGSSKLSPVSKSRLSSSPPFVHHPRSLLQSRGVTRSRYAPLLHRHAGTPSPNRSGRAPGSYTPGQNRNAVRSTLHVNQGSSPPRESSGERPASLEPRSSTLVPAPNVGLVKASDDQKSSTSSPSSVEHINLSMKMLTRVPEHLRRPREGITSINLSSNQLSQFPTCLSETKSLQRLNLSWNRITKLPKSPTLYRAFRELTKLELGFNGLKVLPAAICSLPALRELYLNDNKLTTIPEELGQVQSLRVLNINYNDVTALPYSLGFLPHIRSIQVAGNPVMYPPQDVCFGGLQLLLQWLRENKPMDTGRRRRQMLTERSPSETRNAPIEELTPSRSPAPASQRVVPVVQSQLAHPSPDVIERKGAMPTPTHVAQLLEWERVDNNTSARSSEERRSNVNVRSNGDTRSDASHHQRATSSRSHPRTPDNRDGHTRRPRTTMHSDSVVQRIPATTNRRSDQRIPTTTDRRSPPRQTTDSRAERNGRGDDIAQRDSRFQRLFRQPLLSHGIQMEQLPIEQAAVLAASLASIDELSSPDNSRSRDSNPTGRSSDHRLRGHHNRTSSTPSRTNTAQTQRSRLRHRDVSGPPRVLVAPAPRRNENRNQGSLSHADVDSWAEVGALTAEEQRMMHDLLLSRSQQRLGYTPGRPRTSTGGRSTTPSSSSPASRIMQFISELTPDPSVSMSMDERAILRECERNTASRDLLRRRHMQRNVTQQRNRLRQQAQRVSPNRTSQHTTQITSLPTVQQAKANENDFVNFKVPELPGNLKDGDVEDAPQAFICPITYEIMRDPVCAMDGFSYERVAIVKWLQNSKNSPMTGKSMPTTQVTNNQVLKTMIKEYLDKKIKAKNSSGNK